MTKTRRILWAFAAVIMTAVTCYGADPMSTDYSMTECEGSLTPYPIQIERIAAPDSLMPVYLSHVGRHGARYPASSASANMIRRALLQADSTGTITPLGRKLLTLTDRVIAASTDRWGALDSLGMWEQRAIATRMFENFPELFTDGTVNAISSYSPRSMMSMFSFVHQLDRMNNKLTFNTSTGRVNSALLRPFDVDSDYIEFRREKLWQPAYDEYFEAVCPITAITRVLGRDFPFGSTDNARDLAINEYYLVAGLQAMQMAPEMSTYFTPAEANALWSCFNLRQYLQRTATTVSDVPADIAAALVADIVNKTDDAVSGRNPAVVDLRFGHAETVMPLVSLLRLPGCRYLTNYFDTVGKHWKDFAIVPMAANVQFILFKEVKSGRYYLRCDLNEKPVPLIEGRPDIYVPWNDARSFMLRTIPLYLN